ncbi:MAG: phosphoribosylformylglycinamidine synthase I [Candidatus Omnitrophota bacterium]
MKPKVLIIRTAGTNCDKESEFAFKKAGAQTFLYHINRVKNEKNLSDYQILCLPGGFSYGDDLGAGKILSLEFIYWLKEQLKKFIDKGGLILGICNGFQVLVRTGILPDLDFKQKVTLTFNDSARFEDRWVYLKVESKSIWFKGLPEIINLPVAHGEGKFYTESDILDKIENKAQAALRYVREDAKPGQYPFNPNGSLNDIAGITDSSGKILGLMPHPERFIFRHHSPFWKDQEVFPFGLKFFENAITYFK